MTKYINVRFHFLKKILDESDILLRKIGTVNNSADTLSNVVYRVKF